MALRATATRRTGVVLADLLPGAYLRDAAVIAGAAALTGVAAQLSFHLPGTPVPVTGQTFAALLSGAALGWRRGVLAMLLYMVAGLVGVPWFAGHSHGYVGATFGYIVGFVLAAAVVGALARRGADRTVVRTIATMVLGTFLIYLVGVPWLAASLGISLSRAVALGARPFFGGDLAKVLIAALLLPTTWRLGRPRP